jgi:ferric-dicitrate binding protein FerR (iron transport regulator)
MSDTMISTDFIPPNDALLDRYLSGELSAAERVPIDRWLDAHPLRRAVLGRFVGDAYSSAGVTSVEQRLVAMMEEPELDSADSVSKIGRANRSHFHSGHRLRKWTVGGEASLGKETLRRGISLGKHSLGRGMIGALVIISAVGMLMRTMPRVKTRTVYTTHIGQRAPLTLKDGSRVTLSPGTTLSHDVDYGNRIRSVTLVGEAYFDVRSSEAVPFVVRTGRVSTRVVGTTFSVRHIAPDDPVQVTVMSGKVISAGRNSHVVLAAGDVARISDSTATKIAVHDLDQYMDWQHGQLVFTHTPVPVLLATLGRWYGYEFRLSDSVLSARTVSMALDVTDRTEMLTVLKGTLDVTMTFKGAVVTMFPRRSIRVQPRRAIYHSTGEMGR